MQSARAPRGAGHLRPLVENLASWTFDAVRLRNGLCQQFAALVAPQRDHSMHGAPPSLGAAYNIPAAPNVKQPATTTAGYAPLRPLQLGIVGSLRL